MNKVFVLSLLCLAMGAYAQEEVILGALEKFYADQGLSFGREASKSALLQELTELRGDQVGNPVQVKVFFLNKTNSAVLIQQPLEGNQLFLSTDQGAWLFKEGLRSPLRISQGFAVFGAANLADVLGLVLLEQYELQPLTENPAGTDLRGRFLARDAGANYPRINVQVDRSGTVRRLEYYGLGDRIVKSASLRDYTQLPDGRRFPIWEIRDELFKSNPGLRIQVRGVRSHSLPESLFRPNTNSLSSLLSRMENFP